MESHNEKVEYGKKEIKEIESNVNEVKKYLINEKEVLLSKKVKIKKTEKFTKDEIIKE